MLKTYFLWVRRGGMSHVPELTAVALKDLRSVVTIMLYRLRAENTSRAVAARNA